MRGVLGRSVLSPIYFNIFLSDLIYLLKVENFFELLIDKEVSMITIFPYANTPERKKFQLLQNFKIENRVLMKIIY